ncbi:MAG: aldehyde dehydrogenase [Actinobacteria bacterium]|nr:aldehyde dehydrogenase [Actinomycetota bacterium]
MASTIQKKMESLSGTIFVKNEWIHSSGHSNEIIDPATEGIVGHFAEATATEIDEAISSANLAQREWWAMSALDRAAALHKVADRMIEYSPNTGECLTREMGKPFRESNWEGGAAASSFRYYAEIARSEQGRVAGPAIAGQLQMVIKEPLGTVVSIVPYNFPMLLAGWQAAAALAAGNAVIIKPSELTSLTLLMWMEAFDHLPPGLVQVVTGGAEVGARLVEHQDTHAIAFTGSVPAAQAVAKAASHRFKPALIEASGNDAFIVMPTADIDTAARGAAFAAFLNCGQVCTSAERFYVHRDIYDAFVSRLAELARELRIGSGLTKIDIGPMASRRELERFEKVIARAKEQGAEVVTGGKRPSQFKNGWFYEPTVMKVTHEMDVMHGECFGPLAPIAKVQDLDEAIAKANDSNLGLGANIYTNDLEESFRAVNEIETGIVWVNTPLNDNDAVPFGGRKFTGSGRELGTEGLDQFRRSKMVMIAPKAEADPEWFPYPDADAFDSQADSK